MPDRIRIVVNGVERDLADLLISLMATCDNGQWCNEACTCKCCADYHFDPELRRPGAVRDLLVWLREQREAFGA